MAANIAMPADYCQLLPPLIIDIGLIATIAAIIYFIAIIIAEFSFSFFITYTFHCLILFLLYIDNIFTLLIFWLFSLAINIFFHFHY